MLRRLRSSHPTPPSIEAEVDHAHQNSNLRAQPVRFFSTPASDVHRPRLLHSPSRLPGITGNDLRLLREKQRRLQRAASLTVEATCQLGEGAVQGLGSTLIFAQHEAGTAVCIDPRGWVLTCAHCFGESDEEWRAQRRKWLLYYTGWAVQVECRVWDARRDLALAKVICIELPEGLDRSTSTSTSNGNGEATTPIFTCVPLSTSQSTTAPILCIGQPGADDLESDVPRKTAYELIQVSRGRLRGMIPRADPQDNSEIGTLKHDAWTYWGHSGAPLLRRVDGSLLGLHSSWDDSTAMRHGVPLVAIKAFLSEHLPPLEEVNMAETPSSSNSNLPERKEPEIIVIDSSE